MIVSFTTVLAAIVGTLLAATGIALAALLVARSAMGSARAARREAALATERASALEVALEDMRQAAAARDSANPLPVRPSLREAVALSRHGASIEEIAATCRIGQGEARLIRALHGARTDVAAGRTADIH